MLTTHDRARRLLDAHARHTGVALDGLFLLTRPHGEDGTRHLLIDGTGTARSVLSDPLAVAWRVLGREVIGVTPEESQGERCWRANEAYRAGQKRAGGRAAGGF